MDKAYYNIDHIVSFENYTLRMRGNDREYFRIHLTDGRNVDISEHEYSGLVMRIRKNLDFLPTEAKKT